jgi:hypothetical protein
MVPRGLICGNPYATLDYATFVVDFLSNYQVTPVYVAEIHGHNYITFFQFVMDILGFPGFIALLLTWLLLACILIIQFRPFDRKKKLHHPSSRRVHPLYLKFGSFPRLEDRFVLPVVPYLFILTGVFWEKLMQTDLSSYLFLSLYWLTTPSIASTSVSGFWQIQGWRLSFGRQKHSHGER